MKKRCTRVRSAAGKHSSILSNGDTILFIGSERQWAEEYSGILSQPGPEKRRRITELIALGRGVVVNGGTPARKLDESSGYARVRIEQGIQTGTEGWVPLSWLR